MGLATEPPIRLDLGLRSNADQLVGAVWYASDGVTPVPIESAALTLEFNLPAIEYDVDGVPLPPPDPVRETFTADPTQLAGGRAVVTIPAGFADSIDSRRGRWDLLATSTSGLHRCLLRGEFVVEQGVTVP